MKSDIVRFPDFEEYKMGLDNNKVQHFFRTICKEFPENLSSEIEKLPFELVKDPNFEVDTFRQKYIVVLKDGSSDELRKYFEKAGPFTLYVII